MSKSKNQIFMIPEFRSKEDIGVSVYAYFLLVTTFFFVGTLKVF